LQFRFRLNTLALSSIPRRGVYARIGFVVVILLCDVEV
jgi:hypothetical protein